MIEQSSRAEPDLKEQSSRAEPELIEQSGARIYSCSAHLLVSK